MTKDFNLRGFIILLVLIALICGASAAWDIIVPLSIGLWEFVKALPRLILPFLPFVGVEKLAWTGLVFGVVLSIASALGVWLSHKSKNTLWMAISIAVEIISLLITISAAHKL